MRLGVIGPARGNLPALARVARFLLDDARAERIIYLGNDDAMDRLVASWAAELVGGDPGESALFARAAERCARGGASEIDAFVARERARLELRVYNSLPAAPQRTIEILAGKVAVLVYDKAALDEEDIAAATLLLFGRSDEPVFRRVGARTFVAPGTLSSSAGAAVVDDAGGALTLDLLDAGGGLVRREDLLPPAAVGKMKVQGG